jgi:hypothetical protein
MSVPPPLSSPPRGDDFLVFFAVGVVGVGVDVEEYIYI